MILESSDNASDGGNTAARAVAVDEPLQHAGRCLLESLQVQVDKLQSRVQLLERAADRDALDVWLAEGVPTAHAVAGRARSCCNGSTADHGIRQGEMLEQQLGVSDLASSGASGLAITSDANSQHPSKEGSRTIGTVTSRAKRVSRGTQAMCRAVDSSADSSNRVLLLLPQCSGEKTGNNCDKQNCLQVVSGACAETLVQLPFLSPVEVKPSQLSAPASEQVEGAHLCHADIFVHERVTCSSSVLSESVELILAKAVSACHKSGTDECVLEAPPLHSGGKELKEPAAQFLCLHSGLATVHEVPEVGYLTFSGGPKPLFEHVPEVPPFHSAVKERPVPEAQLLCLLAGPEIVPEVPMTAGRVLAVPLSPFVLVKEVPVSVQQAVQQPGQEPLDCDLDFPPPVDLRGTEVCFLERLLRLLAGSDNDVAFAVSSAGYGSPSSLAEAVHAELVRQAHCLSSD